MGTAGTKEIPCSHPTIKYWRSSFRRISLFGLQSNGRDLFSEVKFGPVILSPTSIHCEVDDQKTQGRNYKVHYALGEQVSQFSKFRMIHVEMEISKSVKRVYSRIQSYRYLAIMLDPDGLLQMFKTKEMQSMLSPIQQSHKFCRDVTA